MRQLTKVLRDLWSMRGRVLVMILALSAGLTSMGAVLRMRVVVEREMNQAYTRSVPASATFDVGAQELPDPLLEALRGRPEVAWAERRATREGRWRRPGGEEWGRGLFFFIEDFDDQRLALLGHVEGARVPGVGEVLVERSAMTVLSAAVGDGLEVTTGRGRVVEVQIAGVVHEPALAPASSEQAGYFYASRETLALLGEPDVFDEVRVLVARDASDPAAVEAQTVVTARWLLAQGVAIHDIEIPPPARHPHQTPSEAVLSLFALFSGLTVVLAAVLCASLLSLMMARQVREVAVMKTLGATRGDIARMTALMLTLIALGALAVSAIPTWALAQHGSDAVARLLNFDIVSYAVPWWVIGAQVAVGVALPLLTAAPTIVGASRASVLGALDEHGARVSGAGLQGLVGALDDRLTQAALRNALRVPRRLLLTVGLLAAGCGLFITAVSVVDAWDAMTEQVYETRHYDVELALATPPSPEGLDGLRGARRVEVWGTAPVTLASASGLPVSRTYPDGGHGSFQLVAVPDRTELVDFALRDGRWLEPREPDGVVLNQLAATRVGPNPIGERVVLVVEGRPSSWRVVGVVEEVAAPATSYVSAAAFSRQTGRLPAVLRVATDTDRAPEATRVAIQQLQRELAERDLRVVRTVPLELLYNAMGEHVVVLIRSLLALALMMAVVGALALASTMSTSVVERTREFGVLQAIGADRSQLRRMVVLEGWFVSALSLPFALVVAVPLAAIVGRVIGQLAFELPLPLELSWWAVAGWSAGTMALATVASLIPARAAMRLNVREALGHV